MSDSSAIEAALLARLIGDPTLSSLMPDGVFFDQAKQDAARFVLVSLIEESDEGVFGGRAIEDALYLIKAVERGLSSLQTAAAAARIEALLEDQPFTVPGYTWMTCHREARIRLVEVDDVDPSIRWQHRGAHWRVQMSLGT